MPSCRAGRKADESRIGRIKCLLLMFQNRFALRLITATRNSYNIVGGMRQKKEWGSVSSGV